MNVFFKYWDRARTSFWFVPIVMAVAAVLLAFVTVTVEAPASEWLERAVGWVFTGGAEGANAVLGTIAGSMITIAGVVFSMTLVALSLASSQFGPRMLRNFMRDTTTQVVLGTFIATFLYCLLVLRSIRHAEQVLFIPHLSVLLGVLLAVLSVGVLIYFIHHVSVSLQANEIVARVSVELVESIDRLFPDRMGDASSVAVTPPGTGFVVAFERDAGSVGAPADGYLQFIDPDALMALAIKESAVLRLERRPGHYLVADRSLVRVWPADRVTDDLVAHIHAAFTLGNQRTPRQDIECTVSQLVEIAVRALSPGVNDPFTAIVCVDHLGSALCRLARREIPSAYCYDEQGQLRLITQPVTFPAVVNAAFNQIRQYGRSSVAVTIRLLESIAAVAEFVRRPEDVAALRRHAEMISKGARNSDLAFEDICAVEERYQTVCLLLSTAQKTER